MPHLQPSRRLVASTHAAALFLTSMGLWAQTQPGVIVISKDGKETTITTSAGASTTITSEPAKTESTAPASAPATGDAAKAASGSAGFLDAIKKVQFSRAPQSILDQAVAAALPAPGDEGGKKPDAKVEFANTIQTAVLAGEWLTLGKLLTDKFADKKDDARAAYLHILDGLSAVPQPPRSISSSSRSNAERDMMQQMGQQYPQFQDKNVVFPADVLALADIAPGDLNQEVMDRLGRLLKDSLDKGARLEGLLDSLEKGTLRLGGATDAEKRLSAARLLASSAQEIHMLPYLDAADKAVAAKSWENLALLNRYHLALYGKEGRPETLEEAWKVVQMALTIDNLKPDQRQFLLRQAVELAPRIKSELGEKWLVDSFTTIPARGLEVIASIGAASTRDRGHGRSEVRQTNLELQHRVVSTLLQAAPTRSTEWRSALTIFAQNWLQEARWSQDRDRSTQRGPAMQYDAYGNVFFMDSNGMVQQQQNNREPAAIPSSKLLDLRPQDKWLAMVEKSLQPALAAQTAELFLKVNEPEQAFPLIEEACRTLKDEGQRLAHRFLQVWTEKNDPNSNKRRTNRYMYVYGYNPQADGIPLTRSKQDRNLSNLSYWVKKLRMLPIDELDENLISEAFVKTHSQAEVYQLANIETVFGELSTVKPATLASLVQRMRTNLGTVWRSPKVQADSKTKRTDKQIQAEVIKGYQTARTAVERAIKGHPEDWQLTLALATVNFDDTTYRNSLTKDSAFTAEREAAFALFQKAAEQYSAVLPKLLQKDHSQDPYSYWFYASLGAVDLEAIKSTYPESPKQQLLIKTALESIGGEAGKRHKANFANTLSTRLNAVEPELKHRYIGAGLKIVGEHEQAREAKALWDYYQDVITEVKLETQVDGPVEVGTQPFGVFVNIIHTSQIEREGGGFQKYLQNQQGGYYYNFGRPPENYREKFEEAARLALGDSFEIKSCTFHTDKIQSRGLEKEGWRVTPYAYLLIQAKGAQVDALPPLKMNLDFLDTSGFVVLPIESARLPITAGSSQPRPVSQVEIKQILDERKAPEGVLNLEIKATAHGLVPPLKELVNFNPGRFEVTKEEDQGVHVLQLDAEAEQNSVVTERLWNLTLQAKDGKVAQGEAFNFGTPAQADQKASYFRYDDADLATVSASTQLAGNYGRTGFPWGWALLALAGLGGGAWWWIQRKTPVAEAAVPSDFALPSEISPLSILSLLQDIEAKGQFHPVEAQELTTTMRRLESQFYSSTATPADADLRTLGQEWIQRFQAAKK